jgi:hypothetical protein
VGRSGSGRWRSLENQVPQKRVGESETSSLFPGRVINIAIKFKYLCN